MNGRWQTLGMTQSACAECRAIVPAKILTDGRDVYFRKFCPEHGESQALIRSDIDDYLRTLRYIKPAWVPKTFTGNDSAKCPDGCGLCSRHEQHLCMPIVEITSRCNLACPICINASGSRPWDLSITEFHTIIDKILAAERQIDVLNISGGEPLLHPDLFKILDAAVSNPSIVRVSISTNGLPLLDRPEMITEIKKHNIVISLQFDGFEDGAYTAMRGRTLLAEKRRILNLLAEHDIPTTLTMTVAGGVNDDQIPSMLDALFSNEHIISLMIQPAAFTGRALQMASGIRRISIPDVVRLLGEAGHPFVKAADFVPLPCSHPLCFSLAFYLMLNGGGAVSVNQLTDAATYMDSLGNRVFFGLASDEQQKLRDMIYAMWSGPVGAVPESQAALSTLRAMLREISSNSKFDPRRSFTAMERKVKSIFIHAFQDADTFDLARVRHCCQAYPQPDGSLIPACVHNVLRRRVTC